LATLVAQLQHVDAQRQSTRPTVTPTLRAMVRAVLAEWGAMLCGDTSQPGPFCAVCCRAG
jgi:hypothetical protein